MNTENNDLQKRLLIDDAGFTLLEIIAVLVIMSILAVVAVPKYFDLQEQARQKAMGTGVAEAVGRINGYFAEQVLDNQSPDTINYSTANIGDDLGDFTLAVSGDGVASAVTDARITLTITGKTGTPVADIVTTYSVPRPGL